MKLAKTVIACVICLTLIVSTAVIGFSLTIDAIVDITSDATKVPVGDTFNVTVAFKGEVEDVASGCIPLTYDASLVEYVGGETYGKCQIATPAEDGSGVINAGIMYDGGIDANFKTLYVCTFKGIADGDASFGIGGGAYAISTNDEPLDFKQGTCTVEIFEEEKQEENSATLYATASKTDINLDVDDPNFTVTVAIKGDIADIGSGSFPLTISNNAIITKVSEPVCGKDIEAEFVGADAIHAGLYSFDGVKSNNVFYTVSFKAVDEGDVIFNFDTASCYFIDVNDSPVDMKYEGTKVHIYRESKPSEVEPSSDRVDGHTAMAVINGSNRYLCEKPIMFTMTVAVSGDIKDLASGALPITFDNDKVKFVSASKLASAENNAISDAEEVTGKLISETFLFNDCLGAEETNVYSMTFKTTVELAPGEEVPVNFNFDKGSCYLIDKFDTPYTVTYKDAVVTLYRPLDEEPTTGSAVETIVNTETTTGKVNPAEYKATAYIKAESPKHVGDTFTIVIAVKSDLDNIASGKLPVFYDASLVEYVEGSAIKGSNEIASASEVVNSRVNETFAMQGAADSKDFEIYSLTFKALAVGTADFKFDESTAYLYDSADHLLDVTYINNSVEIIDDGKQTTVPASEETTTPNGGKETTTNGSDIPTEAPNSEVGTEPTNDTPHTGADNSMAIVAGLAVLAGAAYVFTKKSK